MAFAAINSSKGPTTFSVVDTSAQQPAPAVNHAVIDHAFAGDVSLKKRVYDAISASPQHGELFQDIAQYTSTLQSRLQAQSHNNNNNNNTELIQPAVDQPLAKKRKLENGQTATNAVSKDAPLQFYAQDISFAVPQRKKLTLEITAAGGYLRARNQTTKNIEFGIALQDIEHAVCLPVPEKAQRQFNFCIIPKNGDGVTTVPEGQSVPDTMVWTVPDGPPKAAFTGDGQRIEGSEHGEALIRRMLDSVLGRTKVIRPDDREFVSATPEAHRKGEKAYHVKAHKGSKDGYLFFLSTGILFGFKKPLLFFSFANIDSTSYTSVLQRTFNLVIVTRGDASEETEEFEFSMIDQADFTGIDAYVKRHGLEDASLAEARRAKKYNVNGAKGGEEGGAGEAGEAGAEGDESELQKAERELEDQEDEEEEDYDPGSDGESEGSGSSSEEDDSDGERGGDNDDDDEDEEDADENLVKKELGSEAEDVSGDEL